jgi:alpha-methylacyl-CoA racemase
MLLAFGIACALAERARSGAGQVIDAAMVDGAALLSAPLANAYAKGYFHPERGTNWLDSGAHYYDAYECADGEYLSIGAIEPKFYANLLAVLGLDDADLPDPQDDSTWPELSERIAAIVRTKPRDEWMDAFADDDQCVAPVLHFDEVAAHPHIAARQTFVEVDGVLQPSPAPRFDRTSPALDRPPAPAGHHSHEILRQFGFSDGEVDSLRTSGAIV